MANPYHDAEGKFTSKEGMQQAIRKAISEGDFPTAVALERDYRETSGEKGSLEDFTNPEVSLREMAVVAVKDTPVFTPRELESFQKTGTVDLAAYEYVITRENGVDVIEAFKELDEGAEVDYEIEPCWAVRTELSDDAFDGTDSGYVLWYLGNTIRVGVPHLFGEGGKFFTALKNL